jgi:hypothetical protein
MQALRRLLILDIDFPDEFNQETSLVTMVSESNGFEKLDARQAHPDEQV